MGTLMAEFLSKKPTGFSDTSIFSAGMTGVCAEFGVLEVVG